ncbi:MAG TPA: CoA transferase [Mycobacterium sp.]|jgi:formyl-CoA transferase|nr:CoA transferase [Mycobacterium sp.]
MGFLTGIRVLEVATVVSGPYAGMILSDYGADVTKIEPPGGDPFRYWGGTSRGRSTFFDSLNRGKNSVGLDLKSDDGQRVFLDMCADADVVLENFRPGTLDRLGLGYEVLRQRNPELVYCAISGMGLHGPDVRKPAYDAVVQAKSGFWSQLVSLDQPEAVGPTIIDQVTGIFAAYAVTSALVNRNVTGSGSRVSVSMLESALAFQPLAIADFLDNGTTADAWSRAHYSQSYGFLTQDGKPVAIHVSSRQKFWLGLTKALGREDLASDPRFSTAGRRIENYDLVHKTLAEEFGRWPRAEVLERLYQHDVPCSPINDIAEALSDPQAEALGVVREFDATPGAAGGRYVVTPGTGEEGPRGGAPAYNGDLAAVLNQLDYPEAEIARLLEG